MDGAANLLQARTVAGSAQLAAANRLRSSADSDAPAEAGRKFEALFATQLVKEMRQTLQDGFFGEGPQSDVYGGWLDQFVGEAMARDGGLHLADGIRQSLERKQAAERAMLERMGAEQGGAVTASEPGAAHATAASAAKTHAETGAGAWAPASRTREPAREHELRPVPASELEHGSASGPRSPSKHVAPGAAQEKRQ